ncbi:SAV_915 family protein [Streptomyces sp. NPDC059517]|uniref:SAV_915 family protein n=1 Tax=Streptomyces sp. NPDC059517 TaxID=3346855 RepID=UPI0036B9071A
MSAIDHCEDPEPSERVPAGLLFVPVRSGPAGCTARFFRTPLGGRTAVGFTSAARLAATLGSEQACIRLSEPALRALAAPLGITALTVDPQLSAPPVAAAASLADASAGAGAGARRLRRPWHARRPPHTRALRVTGAAAVVSYLNLLIG